MRGRKGGSCAQFTSIKGGKSRITIITFRVSQFTENNIVHQRQRRFLIIWQAPRAGSMRRILCFDWLPERARWSDTARPGLPVSFPQIKFRQSKQVHESFFSLKLLSAKVKRFFVISLSLWNQKKRQRE